MIRRPLLFLFMVCLSSAGALAQVNCTSSNKLVCQIPFATGAASGGATMQASEDAVAFNAPIAAQLTQLPLVSSSSGVVFVFNKSLGIDQPLENLGPILTERAQTIGKQRLFLGFSFQQFNFNKLDGNSLGAVPFVYQATVGTGTQTYTQYVQQTENISIAFKQYVFVATYGLFDKTDVSIILPFDRVSIGSGRTLDTMGTQYFVSPEGAPLGKGPTSQPYISGIASGIGDVLVNLKQWIVKGERTNVSGGILLRFPSGDARNYLGSGAFGFNPYAIISYQIKPWISPHARFGYQWNTSTVLVPNQAFTGPLPLPGGVQYDLGVDTKVVKHLTFAADFLGNQFVNSPGLKVGPLSLAIPGYDIMPLTVTRTTSTYTISDFSMGLKWNPWGSLKSKDGKSSPLQGLLFYANALFQLNDAGLHTDPVPLVGVSYKFNKL